jgi:hypothetical protein
VRCYYPDLPSIKAGPLNVLMDADSVTGLPALYEDEESQHIMIPVGINAAPVAGNPVWMCATRHLGYKPEESGGAVVATINLGEWDADTALSYDKPWGVLLHPLAARTAVNSAVGIDDNGVSSAAGGWLMYQVFAGNGTATIKVQDAATNVDGSFADLASATSGVIDCASPTSGIVGIGTSAAVRRYLRWQIVLGTATTVTFALGFCRR